MTRLTTRPATTLPANVVEHDGSLRSTPAGPVTIGIDPSLSGFAVVAFDINHATYHGWRLKPEHKGVRRLQEIRDFLRSVLFAMQAEDREITGVAIEGYAVGTKSHAHAMGEAGGVARLVLADWFDGAEVGFPHVVAPSTLKKYATGKGNADKALILVSLFKRWDVDFADNNIGDAYAIARMAYDVQRGDAENEKMREAVAKMKVSDGFAV